MDLRPIFVVVEHMASANAFPRGGQRVLTALDRRNMTRRAEEDAEIEVCVCVCVCACVCVMCDAVCLLLLLTSLQSI